VNLLQFSKINKVQISFLGRRKHFLEPRAKIQRPFDQITLNEDERKANLKMEARIEEENNKNSAQIPTSSLSREESVTALIAPVINNLPN
jgi:hypothetical protein